VLGQQARPGHDRARCIGQARPRHRQAGRRQQIQQPVLGIRPGAARRGQPPDSPPSPAAVPARGRRRQLPHLNASDLGRHAARQRPQAQQPPAGPERPARAGPLARDWPQAPRPRPEHASWSGFASPSGTDRAWPKWSADATRVCHFCHDNASPASGWPGGHLPAKKAQASCEEGTRSACPASMDLPLPGLGASRHSIAGCSAPRAPLMPSYLVDIPNRRYTRSRPVTPALTAHSP
jgi:hypothetical protein